MDKEKFDTAILKIANLAQAKSRIFDEGVIDDDAIEYIDREIIKAARKLLKAAGDDIIGTPTPAGLRKYPSGKREFVCTKLSYRYEDAIQNTD